MTPPRPPENFVARFGAQGLDEADAVVHGLYLKCPRGTLMAAG